MYRKIRQRIMAVLAAASILSAGFPVITAHAQQIPEEHAMEPLPEETSAENNGIDTEEEEITKETSLSETPAEAPPFGARIEYRSGQYAVIGTFTGFTPDIALIQTLYSLDGNSWQSDTEDFSSWHLSDSSSDGVLKQPCILNAREPLKSYIAGEIDHFYLKLHITLKNGHSYETQTAVIERGGLKVLPEGTGVWALFHADVVPGSLSSPASKYARYQLTVPADATAEEVTALLPETLPVEIQFHIDTKANLIAIGVIDCPVTWKPLSLPLLSPSETVTITDAAEEIIIPAGTQVSTPLGIFQPDDALRLIPTDEVRLILNVISAEHRNPTGVLKEERDELKISLYQKPTGAVSIRAYILTEGASSWTELSGLSLLKEFDQPATENSGYAVLLRGDQEPYRSYLAATKAGETPVPFFVGLKIEGGVYDGGELILSWPDIYEQLPDLPKITGAGGNEGNAGADNREDSTENGQRPSLPQIRGDVQNAQPQPSEPNDSPEQQPQVLETEIPSAAPEYRSQPSSEKSVSDESSGRQTDRALSGQRPHLPGNTPNSSDIVLGDTPKLVPPVVQAAPDTVEKQDLPALSGSKTDAAHPAKKDSRIPFFPMTAAIAATVCIGAVLGKSTEYSLFRRIAGRIFKLLNRAQ